MTKSTTEFALHHDETIPQGIRRIATEELDHAVYELTGTLRGGDADDRVHEARKAIKRLRGLLRLVKSELGSQIYAEEIATLRLAAQSLAAARAAAAAGESFAALVEHFREELPAGSFGATADALRAARSRALANSLDPSAAAEVASSLAVARSRVADWLLARDGWVTIEGGVRRVYSRGLEAFMRARGAPSVENMHEWRKLVKYHWFHVRLVGASWPGPMGARRDALKTLGDRLGDDHDLSELALILLGWAGDPPVIDAELGLLLGLIERRRKQLIGDAFGLGARLYAEPAKRLVARFGVYFQEWKRSPRGGEP